MLIYAAADIHGKQEHLDFLVKAVGQERPDAVVIAGDIGSHFFSGADRVIQTLETLEPPVLAVTGNTDGAATKRMLDESRVVRNIHLREARISDRIFVGAGGAIPVPFRSRIAIWEKKAEEYLSGALTHESILVIHPPPHGVRDKVMGRFHAGSKMAQKVVDRCSPALCICGHIHENAGYEILGETVIVNCAMGKFCGGSLIKITGKRDIEVRMLNPEEEFLNNPG